jgi:hypothetical protein
MVLSKRGRNLGPKQTKILVTNLAELTSSQVVCIYQKRWAIDNTCTRSGCENFILAITTAHGVPCPYGTTSCITT